MNADDQSRRFGEANPPLTASYSGFVLGQTLPTSGVTGSPACTTPAGPGSPPGGYPITCSAGTAGAPLPGQTVRFTMAGQSCSATTDAGGTASCSVSVLTALLGLGGYTAAYQGNVTYNPSSANGRVTLL